MYSVIHKIYPGEIKYQKGKSSSKNCSLLSGEPVGKSTHSHQGLPVASTITNQEVQGETKPAKLRKIHLTTMFQPFMPYNSGAKDEQSS